MKIAATIILGAFWAAAGLSEAPYHLVASLPLGAPDRWDYVVSDPPSGRVYVAHSDRLDVVNGRTASVVGTVTGVTGGTHGTAIVQKLGKGYTDDGKAGQAVPFDLRSLKAAQPVPAADDADAVAFEPRSGHVFVIEGDPGSITVIDPRDDRVVATIKAGEKMEYAVPGAGVLYVAGEANRDLLAIDTSTNKVRSRWPAPDCQSPHGLAYDAVGARLFMGCVNSKLMVIDARTGRIVATPAIGRGSDTVAWDPVRRRVFSSNGLDGTVTILQQDGPDRYRPFEPLQTKASGRTMAVDPVTGRLFVAAADTDAPATPGGRPKVRPGTLALLVYEPRP